MGHADRDDPRSVPSLSRRSLVGGALAGLCGAAISPAVRAAPATRSLKALIPNSPTVDVHAHLVPPAWFGAVPRPAPSYTRADFAAQLARYPYIPIPDPAALVKDDFERLQRFEAARFDGTIETSTAVLMSEMDSAGIDIAVNHCMDEYSRPYGREYAVPVERTLEDIARMAEAHPGRLVNFFGVDPRRGAEGLALLRVAVTRYGCAGMGEWLTDQWNIMPNDRALAYPFLALCDELQIPYGNNGSGPSPSQAPMVFEQILRDFPRLKVVHQASGLLTDTEREAHPDLKDLPYQLLALAEKYGNFWLDIDDWQRLDDPGKLRMFRFLQRAFAGPAAGRIMFGTDFPVFTRPVSAAYFVSSILNDGERLGIALRDEDLVGFFSTNALRFLDGPHAPGFVRSAAAGRS